MTVHVNPNPMYYLNHAWEATHTLWGKSCIVLFYIFIWLQIIWAVELIILPRAGWECFYDGLSEYASAALEMYLRAMNVITVGFYLYANRGGIKVWNVAMVFIINAACSWCFMPGFDGYPELEGAPQGCDDLTRSFVTILWVLFWWSLLTLGCAILEHINTPSGTDAESAPLV